MTTYNVTFKDLFNWLENNNVDNNYCNSYLIKINKKEIRINITSFYDNNTEDLVYMFDIYTKDNDEDKYQESMVFNLYDEKAYDTGEVIPGRLATLNFTLGFFREDNIPLFIIKPVYVYLNDAIALMMEKDTVYNRIPIDPINLNK